MDSVRTSLISTFLQYGLGKFTNCYISAHNSYISLRLKCCIK